MTASRYVVGIDLGITNPRFAYVDTGLKPDESIAPTLFLPPQVVQPAWLNSTLLPCPYLPGPNELPAGSLKLPGLPDRDFAVGELRTMGGSGHNPLKLVRPNRVLLSRWLIARHPFQMEKLPHSTRKVSPLSYSQRYLEHRRPELRYRSRWKRKTG